MDIEKRRRLNRESYQRHKEKRVQEKREYRANNPEKVKDQQRKYRELHFDELRIRESEWRKTHKKNITIQNQKHYAKNKEKLLADNKIYRQEHKEELRLKKNEWTKNNLELRAKYSHNYQKNHPEALLKRQIKYLTKIGKIHNLNWYETKLALSSWGKTVKKRDNYTCIKCGSKHKLEADHIKPQLTHPELAFDIDNGQTLCDTCHYKKHGKLKDRQ